MTPTIGSLCSGYGGLEFGIEMVLGPVSHLWHGEFDADASAVLAANWPGVPNLGDITAVDWAAVPPVDILAAGYPCQGESNAGLRRGADDPRHRWPDVARAIRALRPGLVVLENVRGHLRRSFGTVVADLAALGYVGSWACVRASDVGAPHRRERVVIVARPAADADRGQLRHESGRGGRPGGQGPTLARDAGPADRLTLLPTPGARLAAGRGAPSPATAARRMYEEGRRNLDDAVALLPTPTVADARGTRNATSGRSAGDYSQHHNGWTLSDVAYAERWGEYGPAIARWEAVTGRPAPEPTEPGRAGRPRLSPLFVEWLMGLPEGHVTKHVERRSAALRILGNGAVPQQIAHALRGLL